MLTERLELRIDTETMERLRKEAEWRRVPVGELVRDAVDHYLEHDRGRRIAAAEALCGLDSTNVGDWELLEEQYLAELDEELPG